VLLGAFQAGASRIGVAVAGTACGFVDRGDEVPRVPELFGSIAGTTLQLCLIRRRVIATNEELRDRDAEGAGDLLERKYGGVALDALDA
jgi:hypothetical protein